MAGKRTAQDRLLDSNEEVTDVEQHPQRKVPRGRNVASSAHDVASDNCPKQAATHPDVPKQASADGPEMLDDGDIQRQSDHDDCSEDILDSDDDEDSLESNVGSDLLTNVEGHIDSVWTSKPKLTGVKIVEDDATDNVGMQNVARLLRRQRYHDDDISQPTTAPRMSTTRCFRCLLPGHLARDCPNPAREKPCANCAGYGHLQSQCPKSFCFRCNGFGHVLSDCYSEEVKKSGRACVRCGKKECSASGGMDWFRVHRGCPEQYSQSDLRAQELCLCWPGNFREPCMQEPTYPTCCLCGRQGHTGILDSCPDPLPSFLNAEANQAQRLREPSARSQQARGGGYDRYARPQDNDDGRRNRAGPMRLDTGRDGSGYQIRSDHHDSRRYPQSAGAAAQTTQPAARAATGNRYGPQRYGYGPADPQPRVQASQNSGRRRRGFHDGSSAQYHVHASGQGLPSMVAHPPPDVIAYGNRTVPAGYSDGTRGPGNGHMPGGHTVVMQAAQPWPTQQHDISAHRYRPATGDLRAPVPYQQTHAGQPRYTARGDAARGDAYYSPNTNGQGTTRRWR